MEIELKKMTNSNDEDAKFIVETINKYYPKSPFPPELEKIKKSHETYYRAYHNGKIIGMTGYTTKSPYLAETVKTIVFDEFKGQGLGKLLSQAIEDECKRIGFKKIMTGIYEFNHTMIMIKFKQGYKIEGYHRDHEKPGLHEYTLGKFIG